MAGRDVRAQAASTADAAAGVSQADQTMLNNCISSLVRGSSCIEAMEAVDTLLIYVGNLVHTPDETKYRSLRANNIHYLERLGNVPGGQECMRAIGFTIITDDGWMRIDDKKALGDDALGYFEKRLIETQTNLAAQVKILPHRHPIDHHWQSVKAAACHSERGKRQTMEDDEILVDQFGGFSKNAYFGLYDGHDTRETVDFVVKALHTNLLTVTKKHPGIAWSAAFEKAYLQTDAQIRRRNPSRSGCTSVSCVITVDSNGKRMLHTANAGDSRAILCRGGKGIRLTVDHKPTLPEETKRIKAAGGVVTPNKRVNGTLAVSRALGDHFLKAGSQVPTVDDRFIIQDVDIVTALPHTDQIELTSEDTHLILACDGLWDVVSDQEACDFVLRRDPVGDDGKEHKMDGASASPASPSTYTGHHGALHAGPNETCRMISKALVKEALDRHSTDNVTAMVIRL